jgi:hypothetical protein
VRRGLCGLVEGPVTKRVRAACSKTHKHKGVARGAGGCCAGWSLSIWCVPSASHRRCFLHAACGCRYHPGHIVITENGVSAPKEQNMRVQDAIRDSFRVDYYKCVFLAGAVAAAGLRRLSTAVVKSQYQLRQMQRNQLAWRASGLWSGCWLAGARAAADALLPACAGLCVCCVLAGATWTTCARPSQRESR